MNQSAKNYGICLQTYAPIRREPNERTEMLTQLLFGDSIEILDDKGKWLFVKILFDNYEGWVDKKCIDLSVGPADVAFLVFKNNLSLKNISTGQKVVAAIGCSIPEINDNKFALGNEQFKLEDSSKLLLPGDITHLDAAIEEVVSLPYLWGGKSGFGFDCSGLVQYLARVIGVDISRDASEQADEGTTLSFINEAQKGDLAFFDDTEGLIHHVGMMLGNGKIIHASGIVRIDSIDHQGIFNNKTGAYTHRLRVVKRIIK